MTDTKLSEFTLVTEQGERITYHRGNEGYWSATQEGMPDHWMLSRVASRAVEALFAARSGSPTAPDVINLVSTATESSKVAAEVVPSAPQEKP